MAMDPEAQTRGAAGSALSSPLIPSSPALGYAPPGGNKKWWNEGISRQTSKSTVASSGDFRVPAGASPYLQERLNHLQELRSWKHYCLTRMKVPAALITGILVGVAGTVFALRKPAVAPPVADQAPYIIAEPPTQVPMDYFFQPALNNSCLIPHLTIPDGPQTFDACGFVIKSTDEIWNLRGNVDAAIDKYFHDDYVDAGSWGRRIIGKKALRDAVFGEMRAFPDIRIHITDCVCKGNDNDGYKCAMPDVLTGTNLGPSGYGPPTGRFARWTGMVQSLVQRNPATGQWQYVAEWGVHDEWALVQQLGLDFKRVPHPAWNTEPIHDCAPLLTFGPTARMDDNDEAMEQAHIRAKAWMSSRGA